MAENVTVSLLDDEQLLVNLLGWRDVHIDRELEALFPVLTPKLLVCQAIAIAEGEAGIENKFQHPEEQHDGARSRSFATPSLREVRIRAGHLVLRNRAAGRQL